MALVLKYLYNSYTYLFNEYQDPRVAHLPLVGSPLPIIGTMIMYLLIIKVWGPKYMENRNAYDLKYILRFYNAFQVIANLLIFYLTLKNSYMQKEFNFTCQPVDTNNNEPYIKKLLLGSYLYYLSKYVDLFDTVFFVLRKKNKQITFLHVYHHCGMIFAVYIFVKFLIGSHSTLVGVINSLVHVMMYSYYFLTSINWCQFIWFKKYLTQMQLLQFGILTFHFGSLFFNNWCNHPNFITFMGFTQNIFMLILFSDFYYKAYIKENKITKVK